MAKEVFKKYTEEVISAQYKSIPPNSILNFNNENKTIDFEIPKNDSFITTDILFKIKAELTKADGTAYAKDSNIRLVDNWPAHLFKGIKSKLHNQTLEEVDYPGITSTVKQRVNYSKSDNHDAECSGFVCDSTGGGTYSAMGRLSGLGLGSLDDIDFPIQGADLAFSFIRNSDNDAPKRGEDTKTDGTKELVAVCKITIKEFELLVREIEYNPIQKPLLLNDLSKLNDEYNYVFKAWQCIELRGLTGYTLNWNLTNSFKNTNRPVFLFTVFQTNKSNDQLANPSEFDHCDLKNFALNINSTKYPKEIFDNNFEDNDYLHAYHDCGEYKRVYGEGKTIQLSKNEFRYKYTIYVANTTRHPSEISNPKYNINLQINWNKPVPTGTVCYAIIVSHKFFNYDMLNQRIKEIIE